MAKSTPKSVRDRVYLGIAVRSAKDTDTSSGCSRRSASSSSPGQRRKQASFLAKGGNKAIKGRASANDLGLKAVGSKIIAKVNGKRLAKTVDRNAGQVDGRKARGDARLQEERSKRGLR